MRLLLTALIIGSAATLTACPSPDDAGPGCLESEPDRLDEACSSDDDCGDWLLCESQRCTIPPAVLGESGRSLDVRDGAQVVASLQVEVARRDTRLTGGLSDRPCIADGWGLLLEFPTATIQHVEASRMRFDVDIAMAGDNRVVHTVHRAAQAGGEALLSSEQPTRWVLKAAVDSVAMEVGHELQLGVGLRD